MLSYLLHNYYDYTAVPLVKPAIASSKLRRVCSIKNCWCAGIFGWKKKCVREVYVVDIIICFFFQNKLLVVCCHWCESLREVYLVKGHFLVSSVRSGERQKLLLRPVSASLPPLTWNTSINEWNRCYIAENTLLTISKGRTSQGLSGSNIQKQHILFVQDKQETLTEARTRRLIYLHNS